MCVRKAFVILKNTNSSYGATVRPGHPASLVRGFDLSHTDGNAEVRVYRVSDTAEMRNFTSLNFLSASLKRHSAIRILSGNPAYSALSFATSARDSVTCALARSNSSP